MRRILLAAILCVPAIAAADGKATYDKMCASCHGADGRGNADKAKLLKIDPGVLNLGRPESATMTRDQLREVLLKGKAKMPSYEKKLKPEEVEPLLDTTTALAGTIRGEKK